MGGSEIPTMMSLLKFWLPDLTSISKLSRKNTKLDTTQIWLKKFWLTPVENMNDLCFVFFWPAENKGWTLSILIRLLRMLRSCMTPEKTDGFSQMSPSLLESALDEAGCKSDLLIELMKRLPDMIWNALLMKKLTEICARLTKRLFEWPRTQPDTLLEICTKL